MSCSLFTNPWPLVGIYFFVAVLGYFLAFLVRQNFKTPEDKEHIVFFILAWPISIPIFLTFFVIAIPSTLVISFIEYLAKLLER